MAKEQLDRLDLLRPQLAAFFCEPERNFSVEDCFKVVGSFLTRFEKAVEVLRGIRILEDSTIVYRKIGKGMRRRKQTTPKRQLKAKR